MHNVKEPFANETVLLLHRGVKWLDIWEFTVKSGRVPRGSVIAGSSQARPSPDKWDNYLRLSRAQRIMTPTLYLSSSCNAPCCMTNLSLRVLAAVARPDLWNPGIWAGSKNLL
jgi:hypothetical protein